MIGAEIESIPSPTLLKEDEMTRNGMKIKKVVSGANHIMALTESADSAIRQLWIWGSNTDYQLGLDDRCLVVKPTVHPEFSSATNERKSQLRIEDFHCGHTHSLVICSGVTPHATEVEAKSRGAKSLLFKSKKQK
eukprot:TRINITY_DN4264_c0_g2_i3.p2 TRINITY_DN4264_c0_g2~~TRINITY_DN4264_c0_g2_i3.p2  ORF type:complete len:135 (-),score=22.74 TRINITY_DN4264_c0_g2_i3:38-442(-)